MSSKNVSASNAAVQIAVIDRSVEGYHSLVDAANALGLEVILLSGDGDGFAELASALKGRTGIDGLHLFSHGSAGKIHLGQATLHSSNLDQYADTLDVIKSSLSDSGDVLIYGCEVAGTEAGVEFVRQLSLRLDADIAASDDLTGHSALNGDWELELQQGSIESAIAPDSVALLDFQEVLEFSGTIDFSNATKSGAAQNQNGANSSTDAKYTIGGYTLVLDGQNVSTLITAGGYATFGGMLNGTSSPQETKATVFFEDNKTFTIMSLDFTPLIDAPRVFIFTSDLGGSVTTDSLTRSESYPYTSTKINFSGAGWEGISKLYVTGSGGASIAGDLDNLTLTVGSAANNAPVFTNSGPFTIAEDAANGTEVGDVNANDGDGGANDANVTYSIISGNPNLDNDGNLGFAINAETGVITINDADDIDYESATSHTLTIRATDDKNATTDQTVTINVTDVNEPPTATNLTHTKTYTEDPGGAVALDDIVISDVDAGDTVTATLTLNNVNAGSLSTGTFGDTTSTYNAGTGVWSATGSVADVNAALAAVSFTPVANWDQDVTITTRVRDAADTGPADGTITLDVTPVNDAPVLDVSASPVLTVIDEDLAAPTNGNKAGSTQVSALTGGISDVDSGDAKGIAITAMNTKLGTLHFSTDDGATWATVAADISDSKALLLDSDDLLYWQPDSNVNGTVNDALTFRAWDVTIGEGGDYLNAGAGGGTTAFSTASDTVAVTVTAVNDAPTLSTFTFALTGIDEDTTSAATKVSALLDSLGYADIDGDAGGLAIAGAEGAGDWQYSTDGNSWFNVGTVDSSASLLLNANSYVRYVPDQENGENDVQLNVRAWDGSQGAASDGAARSTGATSSHGGNQAFSSEVATVTLSVADVNDAPTATQLTQTLNYKYSMSSLDLNDIVVTDPDIGDTITATLTLSDATAGSLATGTYGSATSTFDSKAGVWNINGSAADVNSALAAVTFTRENDWLDELTITTRIRDAADTGPVDGAITINIVDDVAPTITSIVRQNPTQQHTTADELTWRVTFSEAVKNVDAADFKISLTTTVDNPTGTVTKISDTVYDVTLSDSGFDSMIAGHILNLYDVDINLTLWDTQNITDTTGNALVNLTPTGLNQNSYFLDHDHPVFNASASSPADETLVTTLGQNIVLNFTEMDRIAAGSGTIELYNVTTGQVIETFDVQSSSALTFGDKSLTINPADDFVVATRYAIRVEAGAITDRAGNAVQSLDNYTDYIFGTMPYVVLTVDENSVLEAGGVATVTATLRDSEGNAVDALANVTINLSPSGTATNHTDYSLSATQIIISKGSSSGTVTVTGTDDGLGDNNETVILGIADITNGVEQNTQQVSITLVENNPPVVDLNGAEGAGTGFSATFTEDDDPVLIASSDTLSPATLFDADGDQIHSMTVTLTNRPDGNTTESLALNSAATTAAAGLTVSYTEATGVLSISGAASTAVYQDILRGVTYNTTSQAPNTTNRSIEVVVNDGKINGAAAVSTIAVTPVNDAPVLDASFSPVLTGISEDLAAPVSGNITNSTLVSTLLGGVSDVDTNPSKGIAIVASNTTDGTLWFYNSASSGWRKVSGAADDKALLLRATDRVYWQPAADKNGTVNDAFTFRAWDVSNKLKNYGYSDTTSNGGTTAYSTATDTVAVTVTAVNDAPTLSTFTFAMTGIDENTTSTATKVSTLLDSLGYADVDGDTGGLAIAGAEGSGDWEYSTDNMQWHTIGSVTSSASLLLNGDSYIRYVPDGKNGEDVSFVLRAWDGSSGAASSGGTRQTADTTSAGGTSAYSTQNATVSLNVTDVNDAPTMTNGHVYTMATITEDDTSSAVTVTDMLSAAGWSDVDAGAESGVAITTVESNGDWQFSTDNGATWSEISDVGASNALLLNASAQLRYVGDGIKGETATLDYRAWDQSSGIAGERADASSVGGSTSYSAQSATVSLEVTDVNDTPTGAVTVVGSPEIGATLRVSQTLADVDGLGTFTYQWFANDVAIDDADQADFTLTADLLGKTVTVVIRYTDESGFSEEIFSAATTQVVEPAPAPTGTNVDGATVSETTGTAPDGTAVNVTDIAIVPATRQEQVGEADLANIPLVSAGGTTLLEVGLPTGTGMRIEEQSGAAPGGISGLIAAIRARTNTPDAAQDQQEMTGVGSSFLDELPGRGENLIVRTLIPQVAAGSTTAPSQPIKVSGPSLAVTDQPVATVIDVRGLPSGSVIQLDNIQFVAVVGEVTMIGGAGAQVATGDGKRQIIVLGDDDDVIRGGGGDDLIGSRGGNDRLYGDDGDDLVIGGAGDDWLYGGAGNDVLQGGASDAGRWRFTLSDDELISHFEAAHTIASDVTELTLRGPWWTENGGGLESDDRLSFTYSDAALLKLVSVLYQSATGQLPDLMEFNALVNSGLSAEELATIAVEFFFDQQGVMPQALEVQVAALAGAVWGDSQVSTELVALGVDYLSNGGTWGGAMLALAVNQHAIDHLSDDHGVMRLVADYVASETGWSGNTGNDHLFGGDGNDRLVGGDGNNVLDGGSGTDVAVFAGGLSDFVFSVQHVDEQLQWLVTRTATGHVNTLIDIELLKVGGHYYSMPDAQLYEPGVEVSLAGAVQLLDAAYVQSLGLAGYY